MERYQEGFFASVSRRKLTGVCFWQEALESAFGTERWGSQGGDFDEKAALDEWSGEIGCVGNDLKQQAVSRLIGLAGVEIDPSFDKRKELVLVHQAMAAEDE